MKAFENKVVYVVMTGAKKCSIAPGLIKELTGEGTRVFTFLTDMGRKVTNLGDLVIPGNKVSLDYSTHGEELPLEDLVLVVPATFNTINKVAQGIADSYATTIIASAIGKRKKVIFAPAMNRALWEHPVMQRSLDTLQQWGCQVVWPEITPDRVTMAPLEKIADTACNYFSKIRYPSEKLPSDEEYFRALDAHFSEFRSVGELLSELDLIKGSAGFISKRIKGGILVSATGSNVGSLTPGDVTLVVSVENQRVVWKGEKHPSSEMPIIHEIYATLPEANAIIHTHGKKLTYNQNMQQYASADYVRYGRFGESAKVLKLLRDNRGFCIMIDYNGSFRLRLFYYFEL